MIKALFLVAALCLLLAPAMAVAGELKAGDDAPAFAMPGSDGETHQLSDYAGKVVVVAWFPKAFTGGWTLECKSLRESGDEIRKFDVAYFAASVDDIETNTKFAASLDADFTILSDVDKKVAEGYGVLKPDGGVSNRWTFYIDTDGKILAVDKQVDVKTAGTDIARKLAELGVAGTE